MLLISLALAQDVDFRDALTSGTSATTVYGGTFTGAGWRVDDENSRLYWDLGTQLERGTVAFTTDDITFDNLTGDNNEFIQLFDSGDKWSCSRAVTVRVYGSDDGSSWGDIKLKTWDNTSGLFSEARGGVQVWDGEPHTWTVTWDSSTATLQRDGVEIIALDVTGQDLRVGTLWLPLNTWDYGYSHPIGSVYSNLSVVGYEPGDDDGGDDPVEPSDGGRAPVQDAGVLESLPDTAYGLTDDLPVEADIELSYLTWDLSDVPGTITEATLTLHAQSDDHANGDGGLLYVVGDTAWDEASLTWNNRPPLGAVVGSFPAVVANDSVSFDVSAHVAAGTLVSFAIGDGGDNGAHFWSREGGNPPSLRFESYGDDGGAGEQPGEDGDEEGDDDDAGDSPGDEGVPDGDDTATGGPPGTAAALAAGGCGCSARPGVATAVGWLLGFALAVGRRR